MMRNINRQLEFLFAEWKDKSARNAEHECDKHFVKDGIVLAEGKTEDIAEKEWCQAKRRIAFLLKDQNQGSKDFWDDDNRTWLTKGKSDTTFFLKIKNLFYSLSSVGKKSDRQIWIEEINKEKINSLLDSVPFVMVECKKQPGGSDIESKVLKEYIYKYHNFLSLELEILNPNIIVCFGGEIYDFAIRHFASDGVIKIFQNVYYDDKMKRVFLYAGHPSGRDSYKDHYEGVMYWFRKFVNKEYESERDYFAEMFE